MSPRSRGRPPGRRPSRARRARSARHDVDSFEGAIIRDAADLLRPDATRFEAEVFASAALGAHVLLAAVVQAAAGVVASLSVTGPDALMDYAVLDAASDIPAPRRPHDPALALAALREALTITDVMWPRTSDELYMQHRALVWARINDHAAPALSLDERLAVDPLPDRLRQELREAFLEERSDSDRAARRT